MCLLAIFFRTVPDAPLILGANREEAYARGGEPPQRLAGPCRAVGGRDPAAGGTWLAVNEHGLVIAITNRRKGRLPPAPRSRGLLVRDLLACANVVSAVDLARRELSSDRYAGCNLVCAAEDAVVVLHAGDWLRVRPLPPGLHVLTARDVDDTSDPRIAHALGWLGERPLRTADLALGSLRELCAQTGGPGPPICLRGAESGTVSSSILVLRKAPDPCRLLHAQGPPDRTEYQDYSALLNCWGQSPAAHPVNEPTNQRPWG